MRTFLESRDFSNELNIKAFLFLFYSLGNWPTVTMRINDAGRSIFRLSNENPTSLRAAHVRANSADQSHARKALTSANQK